MGTCILTDEDEVGQFVAYSLVHIVVLLVGFERWKVEGGRWKVERVLLSRFSICVSVV